MNFYEKYTSNNKNGTSNQENWLGLRNTNVIITDVILMNEKRI